MCKKERLLTISDLKLSEIIEQMNDEQLNEYAQELLSFVESFPENEKKVKIAIEAKDYDFFEKYLTAIGTTLSSIHANDMAAECQKQISGLKNAKPEKVAAFATYFLKSVSMLATDIQKAFEGLVSKEQLLSVSDLNSEKIKEMDDNQLCEYVHNINLFIENFPAKEETLKIALAKKDYEFFITIISDIKQMLSDVKADDMVAECEKQIGEIGNTKHEKLEAFVTYFLKSVSMLSIDLQMVMYKKKKKGKTDSDIRASNGPKSILAIDDTEFFLCTLRTLLQNTPYKLTCTTSGNAALTFLQKSKPDLFILDIEMPEMNGYELAQKIRESGHNAPIIFLTGSSTRESVEKALKAGAADFILKPINKAQILERITKFI
jgi:two-component system sensor histidine kinase/response regulator